MLLNIAECITLPFDNRVGRAGNTISQIIELRTADRVTYRFACCADFRLWDRLDGGSWGRFMCPLGLPDTYCEGCVGQENGYPDADTKKDYCFQDSVRFLF